ncbi:Oidioi.mRNA.OKI2018_I69.PAR.g8630.t1.cds [Oikopleura dioica]|uniref:Oidioi.mRNA.OKI2018_I69.PAR.g8630.t1.cds n=1 Tax=Oikopleura dioica TaxID=34765 RepID=A0ABN7RKW1_OIKDI|nr:Oidioi.mRNA.OKI2018_I69.PAR.g8630.t1.cds [Oikopleura dioica]
MRLFLFLTTVIFGNEICKKEIIKGEHCEQDFRSLGKFTTAFPWSYQADSSTREPKAHRFPCTVDSPSAQDVKMHIFNQQLNQVSNHVNFSINEDIVYLMPSDHWHRNSSTVILVHGWNARVIEKDGQLSNQGELFVNEMLKQSGDVNIVLLDWSAKANDLKYWLPATNTQVVGALLGEFIKT